MYEICATLNITPVSIQGSKTFLMLHHSIGGPPKKKISQYTVLPLTSKLCSSTTLHMRLSLTDKIISIVLVSRPVVTDGCRNRCTLSLPCVSLSKTCSCHIFTYICLTFVFLVIHFLGLLILCVWLVVVSIPNKTTREEILGVASYVGDAVAPCFFIYFRDLELKQGWKEEKKGTHRDPIFLNALADRRKVSWRWSTKGESISTVRGTKSDVTFKREDNNAASIINMTNAEECSAAWRVAAEVPHLVFSSTSSLCFCVRLSHTTT